MRLDYSLFEHMYGFSMETLEDSKAAFILSEIKRRQDLLDQKKKQQKETEYEMKIISEDITNVIKEDLSHCYKFNIFASLVNIKETFYHAWKIGAYPKEVDEQDRQKYENDRDWIYTMLKLKMFKEDPEFKPTGKIVMEGYNGDSYDVYYNYKGFEFYVRIPFFTRVDDLSGYMLYYEESPHCFTFDIAELEYGKIYDKFIKLYEEKYKKMVEDGKKS